MHRGYVKLWRKIEEWGWYKNSFTVHLFVHLIINANYKDSEYMGYIIKRGQMVIGRKLLSKSTGISERSIRTSLNHLKSTNEVTIKPTNKFSIVTICNYEIYNSLIDQTDQQTDQQPTSNRPHLKKEKKERKKRI